MKKKILTAAIAISSLLGISKTTYAKNLNNAEVTTVLNDASTFSEIEVHGNVQVYLTSGTTNKVKVYDNYYAKDALVQSDNGVLRITSYTTHKLVVWVTVNDLSKLSVFDNAEVKSFGKLSAIDINVDLHNQALVQLDMDAYSASFKLTGRAKADLSGSVEYATLQHARSSYLNISEFTATNLVQKVKVRPVADQQPAELASL